MIIGLAVGLVLAIVKLNRIPVLSQVVAVFVSFIRGTPIIVQLYLTYYGIPIFFEISELLSGDNLQCERHSGLSFCLISLFA
ncbi:ABC transporter permease subunit [Secundilactobacillus kimchicus]|uniref:ABC transporter permease subunit n=1 Tax=Secundilactobacillus kimchicus TaxID=528209 RepID=UPI002436FD66|nr:ABC transporter permease subunit [Secundilactobacillus kimchicus]